MAIIHNASDVFARKYCNAYEKNRTSVQFGSKMNKVIMVTFRIRRN